MAEILGGVMIVDLSKSGFYGLVVERADGRRIFRQLSTADLPTPEQRHLFAGLMLMIAGEGSRVVKLALCTRIDHVSGARNCRLTAWAL